ncbi:hypothetical protein GWK47_019005 [Chionoecetes opilio]|uniref:Uncharacterized protein n=1 Tax=Chionoecetes opilio TaxID=41210 RepID=A0A8J4XQQ1_CHIOP|nr:hypothetical protein GWK47_019005 [Chionoecetes opilio]
MKMQVCVVAVAAALLVGAAPQCSHSQKEAEKEHDKFIVEFYRGVTAEVCGATLCWPEGDPCFMKIRPPDITTEQQVSGFRANLTRCAAKEAPNADFSTLTLDDIEPKKPRKTEENQGKDDEGDEIKSFLTKFKVGKDQYFDMMECILKESGEIPKLMACLRATQATSDESGATIEAP